SPRLSDLRPERAARAREVRRPAIGAAGPADRAGAGGIGRIRLSEGAGRGIAPGGRSLGPHPRAGTGADPQDPQPLSVPHPASLPQSPSPPDPGPHGARMHPRAPWHRAGRRRRPDPHALTSIGGGSVAGRGKLRKNSENPQSSIYNFGASGYLPARSFT